MYGVVEVGVITPLEWAFGHAVRADVLLDLPRLHAVRAAGFAWLVFRAPRPNPLPRTLNVKTAIVMPIYNEAPARVFAALQAIYEDIRRATGLEAIPSATISFSPTPPTRISGSPRSGRCWRCARAISHGASILSPTTKEREPQGEQYRRLRHALGGMPAYPQVVILDADSLMTTADAIVRLAATMEADPDAGIVQSLPLIVNRNTLPFARVQQFAARVAGPVIAAGLTLWMGRDGNYWGHNAIIRTRAFADHCGMPDLPGRPPFGGHILSHDFVEAALMRRAGWAVYMLPTRARQQLRGKPPSLIDLAARGRRWAQGNLQHIRILPSQGFVLASRQHFLSGDHGLPQLAALDGAAHRRHRARAAIEIYPARNTSTATDFSLYCFPLGRASTMNGRCGFVRIDHRHFAGPEDPGNDRRADRPPNASGHCGGKAPMRLVLSTLDPKS